MIAHRVRFGFSTFGLRVGEKKSKRSCFFSAFFFSEIAPNFEEGKKREIERRIERLGIWTDAQYFIVINFRIRRRYAWGVKPGPAAHRGRPSAVKYHAGV